jgi:hypothetical protein
MIFAIYTCSETTRGEKIVADKIKMKKLKLITTSTIIKKENKFIEVHK